jgi:hypothetical protein
MLFLAAGRTDYCLVRLETGRLKVSKYTLRDEMDRTYSIHGELRQTYNIVVGRPEE